MDPQFPALDDVLFIHEDRVRKYGGSAGLRDLGLLESAVAMPQATFGGAYLHGTIDEMAAAYLFHVARNHPPSTATSGRRWRARWLFCA